MPIDLLLGRLIITANASGVLGPEDILIATERHRRGDWGNICPEDAAVNNEAISGDGGRILSTYKTAAGVEFWVITEADRSVTTVLLPEDY